MEGVCGGVRDRKKKGKRKESWVGEGKENAAKRRKESVWGGEA